MCPLTFIDSAISQEDGEGGSIAAPHVSGVNVGDLKLTPDHVVLHWSTDFCHHLGRSGNITVRHCELNWDAVQVEFARFSILSWWVKLASQTDTDRCGRRNKHIMMWHVRIQHDPHIKWDHIRMTDLNYAHYYKWCINYTLRLCEDLTLSSAVSVLFLLFLCIVLKMIVLLSCVFRAQTKSMVFPWVENIETKNY